MYSAETDPVGVAFDHDVLIGVMLHPRRERVELRHRGRIERGLVEAEHHELERSDRLVTGRRRERTIDADAAAVAATKSGPRGAAE